MRYKALLRNVALVPILAPSLLAAISFIFWFGNQGLLKPLLGEGQIYGAPGIVISLVFATFPHALMILVTALSLTDARLYEAADALGTPPARKFLTITLPGAKYGLISASMVVFTYSLSDFGIPKVIGGNFNMLATDIFKLVIGQQDFSKGAVVAIILLAPVAVTYLVDAWVQKRQSALLSARSVPYVPRPARAFDWTMTAYCWVTGALMLAVLGMAIYASFVKLWPYNFSLSLNHYRMGLVQAGVFSSYVNSVTMAFWCASLGAVFIFLTAYLLEKTRGLNAWRPFVRLAAVLPMGVPGMVLGLGYIFFFVEKSNPLNALYGSMAILVVCTTVHYYTSSHLTALTALEAAGQRVRGGFRIASRCVLAHVHQGHGAGVPAGGARDQPLPLRERHDDGVGGDVPLLAEHGGRLGGHREPGRGGRHRRGGGHGHLDRGHIGAGVRPLSFPAGVARPPHAGLEAVMIRGNDPILLTPGPLTTSLATKAAMLRDWGSWDTSFNAITGTICSDLVAVVRGEATHVCVPLQGSGTFSVEAAISNLVPRDGKVLVPQNGAYCQRILKILKYLGRAHAALDLAEDKHPTGAMVDEALRADPAITHVAQVHCETGTGILNPLPEIAHACARHGKGLIVDAMSSFGAIDIDVSNYPVDAVVAASGKCIEGVPGMGFVIARKEVLEKCQGNSHSLAMDLHDQWTYMQKTTQWRFTPPTHVVAAFRAGARPVPGRRRRAGARGPLQPPTVPRSWTA